MLALGRNPGQYIVIGGDIIIQVVSVEGDLRLAIDAPREVSIVRGEVYEQTNPVPSSIKRMSESGYGAGHKRTLRSYHH